MYKRPHPTPNIQRADGTLWESSYRDAGSAMAGLFDPTMPQFFFREVMPNPHKAWWQWWKPKFIRTGRTWEGPELRENGFSIIN